MPNLRDIVYALFGAWRLACLDRTGMDLFDRTPAGFWKSFFAAAIVAPGFALLLLLAPAIQDSQAAWPRLLLVHASAYVIRWTAYPVLAHQLCKVIGKERAFIGFIVASNWANVIQIAFILLAVGITVTGLLPAGMALPLNAVTYLLILGYQWFVTRTALEVGAWAAVGFVVLDLVIGFMTQSISSAMTS